MVVVAVLLASISRIDCVRLPPAESKRRIAGTGSSSGEKRLAPSGQAGFVVHILQPGVDHHAGLGSPHPNLRLHPVSDPVARNAVGYFHARRGLEADPHRRPPINRQYNVDGIFYNLLGRVMDKMKYEWLVRVFVPGEKIKQAKILFEKFNEE